MRPPESDNLIFSVGGDRDRDPKTLFAALATTITSRPGTRAVVQTTSTLTPPAGVTVVSRLNHAELRELYAKAAIIAVATKPNLHVSGMTVSLEAAATGRPVVITETPGMTDYVRRDRTGLLTPVGDARAMSESLIRLLDEPSQAQELGLAARTHVAAKHSSSVMAARLGEILESKNGQG
ncbi:glycosyltransferase involved in cell wall biosynthesis [Arthrobacter sp. PvP102]|uniref:glycosyltransferase family 4 protein n=1 Tax=unclassified Arthrobacter TaxID=235627 RepID=UPI001AE62EB2|nr:MULTISPECIES: glycosyltransferase family 4 protein [unclassified Arthrobacter]MBP1232517.1 glycosyltransferase involved in cell wall biosynthesis [Arthrobacter sp. PvP103]MBP1237652.1 glycosyltransferase involved in cell wall biosynthesis [Arthrobacter sp. PvP102]